MEKFPDIIVLAGGFGTRLQTLVTDVPKPMAPVAGNPFLEWLIRYLSQFNPNKIILCTGYKHEVVESYFGSKFMNIPIVYSVETTPLGTGGAIKKALDLVETEQCLVLNGDSFFKINLLNFLNFHITNDALYSMALKPVANPLRYGTVEMDGNRVVMFNEKKKDIKLGLINTGVYLMKKSIYGNFPQNETFSIETDFMETCANNFEIYGFICDDYFIDIGIPEDYLKANHEFATLFNS